MNKEKYIYERKTNKGSKYFQIQIAFKDEYNQPKTFYKNIQINEYPSRSIALKRAIAERDKALYEIQSNKLITSSLTIEQLIQKKSELLPCSKSTQQKHSILYKSIPQYIQSKEIQKLTTADIQKIVNEYSLTHSEDRTKRFVNVISKLYTVANMLEYDISDKTKLIIIPKDKTPQQKKNVIISHDDLQTILQTIKDFKSSSKSLTHRAKMTYYLIQIMYYTGCRPAEILAISNDDITNDYLIINKSIGSSNTQEHTIITTKTKQSIRNIPITENLRIILNELQSVSDTNPLLTELDGSIMSIHYIASFISSISKSTGIQFNLYMLRHTVATELMASNINPRAIQDILGHASFSMSMDYARSTEEERKNALKKINND